MLTRILSLAFITFLLAGACPSPTPGPNPPPSPGPTPPAPPQPGKIRYVKPVASGSANGLSWADATNDIQAAIDSLPTDGEVWVAEGTYDIAKTIKMKPNVGIHGGFDGSESIRQPDPDPTTILKATDGRTVRTLEAASNAEITGLNFEGFDGNKYDGGAIAANNISGFKISFCEFNDNNVVQLTASETSIGGAIKSVGSAIEINETGFYDNAAKTGGAIYAKDSVISTIESELDRNRSTGAGGAIDAQNTELLLTDTTMDNNTANGEGGAINWSGTNCTKCKISLVRSRISGSESKARPSGGAIYMISKNAPASIKFESSIVNANKGSQGSVAAVFGKVDVAIINSTIAYNQTVFSDASGEGIFYLDAADASGNKGQLTIKNALFWENQYGKLGPKGKDQLCDGCSAVLSFSQLDSSDNGTYNATGAGNLDVDPLLDSGDKDNFKLPANSPMCGSGAASGPDIPTVDFEGTARKSPTTIGAYECP